MEALEKPPGAPASGPPVSPTPARPNWIPVRSLSARHRERVFDHLVALGEHDRYLRFGYPATDEQIRLYVDALDFERDELFRIFNRRLRLIAMAHLAYPRAEQAEARPAMAEFGVSVLEGSRGRGFGARLFDHAILHARNRGIETLFVHALSENVAMLRIARNAGAELVREGSESDAWLKLPPDDIGSHVGELFEQHAAEVDYQIKRGAQRVGQILDSISEVSTGVASSGKAATE